ncbi:MAG: MraY family glycosyltransferase [Phycisphaerales bacterium]|jgi:UDP-GlcNAc:undecaprenyl-phosphate GlcNAc-1-phosphate transferase|nr:MraY family glycosyltransferase [Phycisphaerales bacterium]
MASVAIGDHSLWSLLSLFLPVLIVSWLATLIFTPLVRTMAIHGGIIDHPNEPRKLHSRPIAYMGGVAVCIGLLAGIGVSYILDVPLAFMEVPGSIVIGMVVIMVTGAGDDVWSWDPRFKVMGQLIAAAALSMSAIGTQTAGAFMEYYFGSRAITMDVRVVMVLGFVLCALVIWWFGVPELLRMVRGRRLQAVAWIVGGVVVLIAADILLSVLEGPSHIMAVDVTYWIGVVIVAALVLGGCNSANLIDGLDGLLSGTAAIMGGGLLVISLLMALHLTNADLELLAQAADVPVEQGVTLAGARIILCMALIGAMLGFLAYNFNPAIIFLGDAGSLLIGYFCIVIILTLGELGHTHFVLAGLIVFGLPIADTILAIFRRKAQGRSASEADANHLHHILMRALGTVKQAVLGMWAIETVFAVVGVFIVAVSIVGEARVMVTYIIFLAIFGSFAVAGVFMGRRALRRDRE